MISKNFLYYPYIENEIHRIEMNRCWRYKKSVDILIGKDSKIITIDVKGLLDTSLFPLDNWNKKDKSHYLVFVTYKKKISDVSVLPEVYVVPSLDIEKNDLLYRNPKGTRQGVQYSKLKQFKDKYESRWDYFL